MPMLAKKRCMNVCNVKYQCLSKWAQDKYKEMMTTTITAMIMAYRVIGNSTAYEVC